jgi:hypothetical protein
MKELKTKSQMILRIAELSEQNTLLRDELYKKSETEQALQTALEENAELKDKVDLLDRLTDELHDRHITLAETYQETRNTCKKLIQECEELKCLLVEIQDIASVNAITTCWTVIDNCDKCADKTGCGSQNPLKKLEIIRKKIHEVLVK